MCSKRRDLSWRNMGNFDYYMSLFAAVQKLGDELPLFRRNLGAHRLTDRLSPNSPGSDPQFSRGSTASRSVAFSHSVRSVNIPAVSSARTRRQRCRSILTVTEIRSLTIPRGLPTWRSGLLLQARRAADLKFVISSAPTRTISPDGSAITTVRPSKLTTCARSEEAGTFFSRTLSPR